MGAEGRDSSYNRLIKDPKRLSQHLGLCRLCWGFWCFFFIPLPTLGGSLMALLALRLLRKGAAGARLANNLSQITRGILRLI